ncbi:protein S-acyltransferase [Malassezia cuniculi]|uniref:Palmitoyltransferase n=1 Tax=Malassezia cuniculi TaxID=948313 RepID=A0AAF0J7K3_9BASI|nr:protein S-acyltransferase [Malassezia cuniculi]
MYVWRICAPMIRQTPDALGRFSTGAGLLVGYTLIWLLFIWSYVSVMACSPGNVKDYISEGPTPETTHAPAEPIPIQVNSEPAEPIRSASTGASLDSCRNTQPFSSPEEREHRWTNLEASPPDGTPADSSGGTQFGVSPSSDKILAERAAEEMEQVQVTRDIVPPAPQQEQIVPAEQPAPPIAAASTAPQLAPAPVAPTATLQAMPDRVPPHPVYDPVSLYCYRCQRARPPRAHHCRRCGTCVFRMDHHCPWVGVCIGAQNYNYYYNTILWAFFLSLFQLVSVAALFAFGALSHTSKTWSERIRGWPIDGYMISILAIAFFALIFTGGLVALHTYLAMHNVTTIEQRSINTMQSHESLFIGRYYSDFGQGGSLGKGLLGAWRLYRAKRRIRDEINQRWGNPVTEGNAWWIGSREEYRAAVEAAENSALVREKALVESAIRELPPFPPEPFFSNPLLLNMELSLGRPWKWFFPIGPRWRNAGLRYPLNPRYSAIGEWQPRDQWPVSNM